MWSLTASALRSKVFAWFRALSAALDAAFVFASLVFASTDEALRFFYALSEVVSATAEHAHAALTSLPEPLRLVSSSAKGQSFGNDSIRSLLALHG
jgi:hypothetical protein